MRVLPMIGTAIFLQVEGSLATNEYPLRRGRDVIPGTQVKTFEKVKYTEDLDQVVTLPEFSGWRDCSMVCLESDSTAEMAFYWITSVSRSSIINGSVDFVISYNAPTSLVYNNYLENHLGTTYMKGIWSRTPTNICPWMRQAIVSGTMSFNRTIKKLGDTLTDEYQKISNASGSDYGVVWVTVTATRGRKSTDTGQFHVYSFPSFINRNNPMVRNKETVQLYISAISGTTTDATPCAALIDFINEPEIIGLTASTIQDVSVSMHCPYKHSFTYGNFQLLGDATAALQGVCLETGNESAKIASYAVYDVTSLLTTAAGGTRHYLTPESHEVSLTISQMEYDCGNIAITDVNGSDVFHVPNEYFDKSNDGYSLSVSWQLIVDYGQMYYRINIKEAICNLPCGHLPYLTEAWAEYAAYSRSLDIENMNYSIQQTKNQAVANIASQTANAIIGVATGGASLAISNAATMAEANADNYAKAYRSTQTANQQFNVSQAVSAGSTGTGIIGGAYAALQSMDAARFNQKQTERRIQMQPDTTHNLSDGLQYIVNGTALPVQFRLYMPDELTKDIYDNFIANYGYCAEGQANVPIQTGYYQGTLFVSEKVKSATINNDSNQVLREFGCGARFDRLVQAFNNGLRFVLPTTEKDTSEDSGIDSTVKD